MKKCHVLHEYSIFIEKIKVYSSHFSLNDAVIRRQKTIPHI